ncbi:stealth conserved region 3 domain-containing protein [Spirilliplanes yamanashiensis]|uniref:Exopolysaccharide phosphotransferase n=1 Tax=Spirilliplanes yamanashiensis TaxID=42233 RepID=A0A8J4DFR2_9ACTN|nr:stealth conserved region 3 domain-containing protein [Spirilliplanes yamanashiensis]MDP9814166.1 glycosyltransferase involved in cell wall biosynthesis [Spirilliplanes yamanashiensis]GIJ00852.1 exopolysaccharide phosphotransferase [Spirilliplanes yamanashiensis]
MRITYLLTWADAMGGTERTVLRQANWLAGRHDVEVLGVFRTRETPAFEVDDRVTSRFLVDSRGPVQRPVERELDVEACRVLAASPSRLVKSEWEPAYNALTDLELESALRETDADVVVTTSPALMAVVSQLVPRRVVVVHQEHRVAELRRTSGDPYAIYAARMDAIAVLSERTRDWFGVRLGEAAPRLAVIPNAVESGYRPRSSRMNRTIMMAGRFTAEKQFDHAVSAFAQLVPDHPDWRLRIFGDGLRASVERQIAMLRMGEHVELMGTSFSLDQEWSKASIALLTSRVESFGLTLIEAMGAGVPSVAYDCPNGPREIIADGVTGFLVPPDSIDELAAGLRKLIEDDELRHDMGNRALKAVERYSVDAVMPQWEALYTELLAGRDEPGWNERRSAAQALQWAQESEAVVFISAAPQLPADAETWAAAVHAADPELVWSHGQLTRLRDDLTPGEVAQLNLDLAVEALERAGVRYFLVRQPHPTFRIAVEADDRTTILEALAGAFTGRPAYVEALDPQGRGRGVWPAAVCATVDKVQLAASVRIFEPVLTTSQTLRMGAFYGCRIEFWETSPSGQELVAPAGGNLAGMRVSVESLTPATMGVGGRQYRTVEPFTRTLGGEFTEPVDVVYTWVDGDDPAWLSRKAEALGAQLVPTGDVQGHERFRSRNELMYSLRSIDTFAPWVNRIWIVTDRQTPEWLDLDHPKVRIVDHRDIFTDPAVLPSYNSHAIETQLHHIEGLSEHFLYLNDDVFFGRLLGPDSFFADAGLPKAFASPTVIPLTPVAPTDEIFAAAAKNNRALLEKAYGRTLTHSFLHAPHAHRRSTLSGIEQEFAEAWQRTAAARVRTREDISPLSSLAHHYGLMTGRSVEGTIRCAFVNVSLENQLPKLQTLLQRRWHEVFCLNDYHDGDVPADDQLRIMEAFLGAYFPIPSQYERGSERNRAVAGRGYRL